MIASTPDVNLEPTVEVFHWTIVKLKDSEGNITEHVAGHEYYDYARVSTAIVDKGDNWVKTQSGRVYKLIGDDRKLPTRDAAYVLHSFKMINDLEEMKDE